MVMKRPDFDVIVAGAGAGGAAAAYYLTQAGLSVLVIEKPFCRATKPVVAQFPGEPWPNSLSSSHH